MPFTSYDDDILATPGILAHYRFDDGSTPLAGNGPGALALSILGSNPAWLPLFTYQPEEFLNTNAAFARPYLQKFVTGDQVIDDINTAQAFTLIFWCLPDGITGTQWILSVERNGQNNRFQTQSNPSFSGGIRYDATNEGNDFFALVAPDPPAPVMYVVTNNGGEEHYYQDGVLLTTFSQAWYDLSAMTAIDNPNGAWTNGYFSVFDRALSQQEITDLHTKRRFQGEIKGTATVDGSGAAVTVRAFRRSDGRISGEATAASDGSYTLVVTDNVDIDLLALPPAGVAARPLAHGPILPDPIAQ